jgi:uncharacterized protein YbaR (Trm112 family)
MHLLLTDVLTCPRCGPTFGLILLADRMDERQVITGSLGCPNCRDAFRVSDGFADLRAPPRGELGPGLVGPPGLAPTEESGRITALLGVPRGPGTLALIGEPARHGPAVAALVEGVQVVGIDADLRLWTETGGFSRLVSAPGIPFFTGVLRGVTVDARLGPRWIAEAARVVAPMSRVVVLHAGQRAAPMLQELGLTVLATEAETVVAARS